MTFLVRTLFFIFCTHAFGGTPAPTVVTAPPHQNPTLTIGFDVKKANQQFDRINLQLSVQNLNIKNLEAAVETLSLLNGKALRCIENRQKKLNNLEELMKQDGVTLQKEQDQGADLVYLNAQQKQLADEQAQCRLFSIRATEAIDIFKSTIAKIKQKVALTRQPTLWSIIYNIANSGIDPQVLNSVPLASSYDINSILALLAIFFEALAIAAIIILKASKTHVVRHYFRFVKYRFIHTVTLGAFFFFAGLASYFLVLSQFKTIPSLTLLVSNSACLYLLSLVLVFLFFQLKKIRAFFYWDSLDISFFKTITYAAVSFYALSIFGHYFALSIDKTSPIKQLCQLFFLLAVLATTAYFISYFCERHRHVKLIKKFYNSIRWVSTLLLLITAIIGVLGYNFLAEHLTFSGFMTFIIIAATLILTRGTHRLYLMLSTKDSIKTKLISLFGYRPDQVFTEFLILKTILQILLITSSIYLIGQIWGFATDFVEIIYDRIINGFHLASVIIYPTRIISGIVVFCTLYLVFRALSTGISNHQQFEEEEEETQVAVASILTYIGFALALLAGFLVAGFDFTGLAIIAGALSVGIGLGLQSIVNNFVSGLILLIEKPIKPGDRIKVDDIEGFVKKIRVRSTQVITPSREDIIIPNSDLITRPVTNYMFSDKLCRINCEVSISYGTDVLLVKNVLLEIANQNEEVIKTGRNKPVVFFKSFDENAILFELSCLIRDVNNKTAVHSDLNFAIEQAFRENSIEMPFPQREIHLKLSELKDLGDKIESM